MSANLNLPMLIGATLSAIAALLHIAIIFGGPAWYRFFGAGERMARAAAAKRIYPTIVTFAIASVLAIWSAYGYSAAGLIAPLPLLHIAICIITAIYLLRGSVIVFMLLFKHAMVTPFWWWSSLICLSFGVMHVWGLMLAWHVMALA